jgi:hypothetical protein
VKQMKEMLEKVSKRYEGKKTTSQMDKSVWLL